MARIAELGSEPVTGSFETRKHVSHAVILGDPRDHRLDLFIERGEHLGFAKRELTLSLFPSRFIRRLELGDPVLDLLGVGAPGASLARLCDSQSASAP